MAFIFLAPGHVLKLTRREVRIHEAENGPRISSAKVQRRVKLNSTEKVNTPSGPVQV